MWDRRRRRRLLLPITEIPLEIPRLADESRRRHCGAERRRAPSGDKLVIARDEDGTGPQVHEQERA